MCARHQKKIKELVDKFAEAQDELVEWRELYADIRTAEYRQRSGQLPA